MHVTFGRVSALRRETTSYQFSHSAAVAVETRRVVVKSYRHHQFLSIMCI